MLYTDHALRKKMSQNNRLMAKKFSREQVCAGMHEVMMAISNSPILRKL
jgi:hypothetical protein